MQKPDAEADEKENVSQYEFIPWVLSQCSSVKEVRSLLMRINLSAHLTVRCFRQHSFTGLLQMRMKL